MALFSMRMQVIKRSAGRSLMGAVAYRSGEKIHDQRQDMVHDYSRRGDVERTEMMFPADAPNWVKGISREAFWNRVDAFEKRKDAQTARELRIMIPRELLAADRITIVRDYVTRCFVAKGMVADVSWHNKTASDGLEQPHAHVMLTMRPLTATGFGQKSRHDFVPDPEGRTHPDGRPVMVESDAASWNSAAYYEQCRENWETTANAALERVGSAERIDRRSLLERGLARMPEPALRIAWYMKDLYGVMQKRFGQFQVARHYRAVEDRAKAAFRLVDADPVASAEARAERGAQAPRRDQTPAHKAERFMAWFDRQLVRLAISAPEPQPTYAHGQAPPERAHLKSPPTPDMER
jgi:ATP-dependent exoDNAse (exonuclease V) alpha subunit